MLTKTREVLGRMGLRRTPLWRWLKIAYNDSLKEKQMEEMRHAPDVGRPMRILAINHFFDGELESLRAGALDTMNVGLLAIAPEPFFSRGLTMFPESVHCAQVPYDDPSLKGVRRRYRSYCAELFEEIRSFYEFDCILTPSDSFFWLREFIIVAQQHGIPTIVADKEGTISPRSFAVEPTRIKKMFPPIADYFFVWSERQRKFWLNAGASEEIIYVVGSARSDLMVNLERSAEPKNLLFFDFDHDAYIQNMDWGALHYEGERSWDYLRDATHRVIADLAEQFPEVDFQIKCHPQRTTAYFNEPRFWTLPNIRIITGRPVGLPKMIAESYAVVGFQTTGLLEASVAKMPVFYVGWGSLHELLKPEILPLFETGFGIEICHSEQELRTGVQHILRRDTMVTHEIDRTRLSEYFAGADGRVAYRILEQLSNILVKGQANVVSG